MFFEMSGILFVHDLFSVIIFKKGKKTLVLTSFL